MHRPHEIIPAYLCSPIELSIEGAAPQVHGEKKIKYISIYIEVQGKHALEVSLVIISPNYKIQMRNKSELNQKLLYENLIRSIWSICSTALIKNLAPFPPNVGSQWTEERGVGSIMCWQTIGWELHHRGTKSGHPLCAAPASALETQPRHCPAESHITNHTFKASLNSFWRSPALSYTVLHRSASDFLSHSMVQQNLPRLFAINFRLAYLNQTADLDIWKKNMERYRKNNEPCQHHTAWWISNFL